MRTWIRPAAAAENYLVIRVLAMVLVLQSHVK